MTKGHLRGTGNLRVRSSQSSCEERRSAQFSMQFLACISDINQSLTHW